MAYPRISYNSKTIDFTQDAVSLQYESIRMALRNTSASGKTEVLNVRQDIPIRLSFQSFINSTAADANLKRYLDQWFSWAQKGGGWYFARDSAKQALTTLSGSEAVGQTVIGLVSTTGLTAGDLCIIRSADDAELVKILTVDSSVQVTLTESINFAYASGSRFRHQQYWPARLVDNAYPVIEQPPLWFDVNLTFIESTEDL